MPVLPVPVPGAAVSPGISSCNFVNAPGANVTVIVFVMLEPSSFALTVTLCAVVDDVSVAV